MATWLVIGATRGIGLEFVRQLLRRGDRVLATAKSAMRASQLWGLAGAAPLEACRLLECDVAMDASISVCEVYRLSLVSSVSDFEKEIH